MTPVSARLDAAFGEDFSQAKAQAKAAFDKLREATERDGFAVVAVDGREIAFSGRGFKEVAQHAADRRVLSVAANLKPLFESAVPLYSTEPDASRGKQQVAAFHYYGVKADFGKDGQAFVLLEVVERSNGDFFYDADATSVEEIRAASSTPLADQTKSGAGGFSAARSGRLSQWWSSVNPADVSKVVDPATGEPLVVYHGTAADFDAFDNKKTGVNDRGLWGRGHYFSAFVNSANSYALRQGDGARIIPSYVSIKNSFVLTTGGDRVTRLPDGRNYRELVGQNLDGAKIKELALEGGHDGVIQILPNGSIGDLVVYSPEQIKSATGNNGQFDPANPDIRFSRSAAPSLSEVAETGRDTAWTGPAASKWDDFIYKMQDKHIDTKRALEAVRATQQKILI
ncbi:hypothetical protein [Comamonas denitrificans]|uniref:ADP-ribosyltransferase-containing protein n=1 Tax=Comamonas denitrificans TaxID=117506 RepID=UPI003620627F